MAEGKKFLGAKRRKGLKSKSHNGFKPSSLLIRPNED